MKRFFVFIIFSMLLVPLARTVFAAPATPGMTAQVTQLPVNGTMQTTETYDNSHPTLLVNATGSGDATQLGRFVSSYKVEWDFLDLSTTGSAYFFTQNGDSLQAEAVGQAVVDQAAGMYNVIEIYTITSGTGRFEGASGTLTIRRLVNLATGAATSTFEGTLLMP